MSRPEAIMDARGLSGASEPLSHLRGHLRHPRGVGGGYGASDGPGAAFTSSCSPPSPSQMGCWTPAEGSKGDGGQPHISHDFSHPTSGGRQSTVLWCSNAVGNPEIICICFFSARLPCQPCRAPHFTLEPLFRLPGATRLHSSALPTGEPFCRMVPGPSADQRIPHGASTATLVEL
ncbi:unnamed protein product [Prorocentrum cordatum]|uniref:Uncharacterized protein n=1 Tax=Prorocentrum cordatum TaxID=2364126 RepID=A0ABN9R919_9DINO|nr:unnamed protein product [Polarella glacialis]